MDSVSTGVVDSLIQAVNHEISKELIEKNISINPEVALNPTAKNETTIFKGKEMQGLSPVVITGMLSSQSATVPVIMMMIIITAGSIVISSDGDGEGEQDVGDPADAAREEELHNHR